MLKTERPIQLFLPTFRTDECLAEIRECLSSGWTGLGFKTLEIERAWADFTGLSHAHFVNSATAALHLAFQVLRDHYKWKEGDEVITTPLTFVSTSHAVTKAGLKPVFADVDEYLCLDPDSVDQAITDRTRAVVFVGMGGTTGQLPAIADLCRDRGLRLVLDAAHMAGTRLHGRDPGHLADVACYSFQAVKNLPTADSGMVCFADGELDGVARKCSWLGIDRDTYARTNAGTYAWMYDVEYLGDKYHGNSIMAALALVGLRYLENDNAYRRQIAEQYRERLAQINGVAMIPMAEGCISSQHLFQILVDNRDAYIRDMQAVGIFPGVHYRLNTDFSFYSAHEELTPNATKFSRQLISLPLHLQLSTADVDRVVSSIAQANAHVQR